MPDRKLVDRCISCALIVMVLAVPAGPTQPAAAQGELPPPPASLDAIPITDDRRRELLPLIRAALDQAAGMEHPARVQIDDVRLETGLLTVDINPAILETGADSDTALAHLAQAVSSLEVPEFQRLDFYFTIGGQPAQQILLANDAAMIGLAAAQETGGATSGETDAIRAPTAGPLAGRKVAISAGHGWYWNETARAWRLARGNVNGVVEDDVNAEIAAQVVALLQNAGAVVYPLREPNFGAGNGASGKPKWQEGGTLYTKSQGAPADVWNVGSPGGSMDVGEKKDVNSRPLYANWRAADILVSIHNNAGGGVGTVILYDTNNGQQVNSLRLANSVWGRLINRLRADYQSDWYSQRGVKGSNGGYGENRLATRPAIIVEVAFMDNTSNNAALKDSRFKQISAQGIYEGILQYFGAANPSCPAIGSWKGEYYNGRIPNGTLFVCRDDSGVNFNWGEGAPASGVAANNFSARWTRTLYFDTATYRFHLKGDDGIRLWVDGNLLIDQWKDQGFTEYTRDWALGAGNHSLKVEYYENGGGAAIALWWDKLAPPVSGYNRLVARHSGRCMDVTGGSRNNGAVILQWDCHSGDNQAWSLVPAGSYFKLVAKHSGKCLDVYGGSRDNGARIIQWDCHGGDNQLFRREQFGAYYRLRAKHSNRCIDVYGGQIGNGTQLIQWDCHAGNNQLWSIQPRSLAALDDPAESIASDPESALSETILAVGATYPVLIEHTFRAGDSPELAAEIYQTTVDAIRAANPGLGSFQPGTTVMIPVTVPVESGQSPYRFHLPMIWR
jgi:N-acetylmuramoyl-L-alanine amidase